MKIHLLSDLHNEFLRNGKTNPNHLWSGSIPETDADIIILAGDIDTGTNGAEWGDFGIGTTGEKHYLCVR